MPEEALHKVHVGTGISKHVLERVLEDWECHVEIRISNTARGGNEASKREKAPLGTSTYSQQYVYE